MRPLFDGIYAHFTSTSTGGRKPIYTNVSGRMYLGEARQGADAPYIVYSSPTHNTDYNFTETFERVTVQFNLYSETASAVEINTMWTNFKAAFDDAPLTCSGYRLVRFRRDFQQLSREIDNDQYWVYLMQYEALLEQN